MWAIIGRRPLLEELEDLLGEADAAALGEQAGVFLGEEAREGLLAGAAAEARRHGVEAGVLQHLGEEARPRRPRRPCGPRALRLGRSRRGRRAGPAVDERGSSIAGSSAAAVAGRSYRPRAVKKS